MIARRLRAQDGFGLVELLIAMTVMAIGIMAIVAGFSSGIVAVSRASRIGTAGTLADKQMEAYRALPFNNIALTSLTSPAPAPYSVPSGNSQTGSTDLTACNSGCVFDSTFAETTYCNAHAADAFPNTCKDVQSNVTGPDGLKYRVDTYIVWNCATGTLSPSGGNSNNPSCGSGQALPAKQVTVTVLDGNTPTTKTWFSETSTFDRDT